MTKRTDEQEALTGSKPRRRRKGGLRVPSDNVPRPKQDSETDLPAPQPEDPRLAARVAYAFEGPGADEGDEVGTSNGADTANQSQGHLDAAQGAERTDATSPFDDEDPEREVPVEEMSDADLAALGAMDDDTDASTEFPVSERAAAADSVESSASAPDLAGVEETAELPRADRHAFHPTAGDAPVRAPVHSETGPMAELAAAASTRAPTYPAIQESGDSVDIAFDDEDEEQLRRAPAVVEPKGKGKAAEKARRASTMELSIADLEEVMEEDDEPTEVAVTPPEKPEAEAQADDTSPAASRSPGDSGEMLTDDLLEEVSGPPTIESTPRGDTTLELHGEDMEELGSDESRAAKKRAETAPPPPPKATSSRPAALPAKRPPPAPGKAPAAAVAGGDKPTRRGKPWFEEVFDEDYLRTLPFLTPQATQGEAQFVMESLSVEPGGQILDVGCGYGRHAMELAARGYHVVGLDSSLPLLLRGADEAQRRGLTINFVHGDMRELNFEGQFDGAYCLFSSFGYFDDETNKKTAQNIARALKPNARCVFEVLNRDYLLTDLPARVWWEGDGCVVLEEVEFNYFSSRIVSNRSIVFDDGRQVEQEISMRCFSLHELGKLLHAAGFRVLEISGNMATRGRFFGAQSRDLVVVAEHRGDAKPGDGT